jgi:NADH:ubiquinone oxidoreductase subunit F (NADH-binding)
MAQDIISKLKEANLTGRGGAGFPAALKWEAVKNTLAEKKYVVANGSEGEMDIWKDGYILEKYPEDLVAGVKLAVEAVNATKGYIYLRHDYFKKFKKSLEKNIGKAPIEVFKEFGGYIGGEETALLNSLEGKRCEPRMKPPRTSEYGLFGCPTVVNNIETFYWAAKINKGEYKNTKFYSIGGQIKKPGVYELPIEASIKEILEQTNNFPDFPFFLQIGGGSSGEILASQETNQKAGGAAGIIVFHLEKTKSLELVKKWSDFFLKETCGQCTPCREGVYRLREILAQNEINQDLFKEIFFNLKQSSFCAFGRSVPCPFETLIKKIWKIK